MPNIVFIIMDDLCWGDLACHGNPHTSTPILDQLHADSVRLTRYCTGPLCSPARASVITGRYHLRTRVLDTYCGRSIIDPDEPTVAKSLHAAGYRTGAFGKWHLGDTYPSRACDMGFEETLMHLAGGIGQPGDRPENHARPKDCYFDPVLLRNGVPEPSQGYCTDIFTDAAIAFIENHRHEKFFCYLATNAPHSPLIVADQWADPYRAKGINDTHARLYGMVENIDWNVGRLLVRLEELGLADDTIVVYTSDHGPCGSARDRTAPPDRQDRFNAGLRGIKGSLYEGGIRVPCFWRWPRKFPRGVDVDRVTHPVDVLPTLLTACKVAPPSDQQLDGVDLLPLMTGKCSPKSWPDRRIYMQWHRGDLPVRYRNYAVITQQHKLIRPAEDRPDELYDLVADPGERRDLAAEQPERVAELRRWYDLWLDEVISTRGPGTCDPPAIVIGSPQENPTLLTRNDWRVHGPRDAWYEDDVRCHWEINVAEAADFCVTIRFKPGTGAGQTHLRVDDVGASQRAIADQRTVIFERVRLPAGPARLEAWRHLEEPVATALHTRFMPPLYVELEKL